MSPSLRNLTGPSGCAAYFAGPSDPPGALRDLLEERIERVPPGGRIDWATYYFRDRRLAQALIAARRRGVDVRVSLEARPRRIDANERVVSLLSDRDALGAGLRRFEHSGPIRGFGRLHEKLYCFSHPAAAFVGSFNPSGDVPEEAPEVIREIGDHDRGFNFLLEIRAPALVGALVAHAESLHGLRHLATLRSAASARVVRAGQLELHFWPRLSPHPLRSLLAQSPRGARVRIAASHVKGAGIERMLLRAARRGVDVRLITHATQRRVPIGTERRLREGGVSVRRLGGPDDPPLHDKFVWIDHADERCVLAGSFNLSSQSMFLNHEIGVLARDPALVGAFADRWEELAAAAEATPDAQ
jgi:phosphatidylserine/phosphatidylglycerophosphate/cardiolipin synthase-like enzyme